MSFKGKAFFVLASLLLMSQAAWAEVSFKPGFSIRSRYEFWKNVFDQENSAKDNRSYYRQKTSVWGDLALDEKTKLFGKLTNEFKAYGYIYNSSTGKKGQNFYADELVVDNLYLEIKDILGQPVSTRLGRQDFLGMYGEGFLIADGTPVDGSRTFYFNAAQASWKINDKNTLDAIYINNPQDENFLPVLNDKVNPAGLNATDELGAVLYWKNKFNDKLSLEPYYIFKQEDDHGGTRLQARNSHIHTQGLFGKYALSPSITLRGQLAFQEGDYGESDRFAYGGYGFVDYRLNEKKYKPAFSLGYADLSGDDPSTVDTNEGWDPLFSRYPWLSELYVLGYNSESGTGYWTNTTIWRAESSIQPNDKIKIALNYNFLRAHETPASTTFAKGDGKTRGSLPQFRVDYKVNKNVTTYFLAEYLFPGDFYDGATDPSMFLRTEITVKF